MHYGMIAVKVLFSCRSTDIGYKSVKTTQVNRGKY